MYTQLNEMIDTNKGRAVEITVKLLIENTEGDFNVTDIMLQGGSISTKWAGHPSEIRWTVDG